MVRTSQLFLLSLAPLLARLTLGQANERSRWLPNEQLASGKAASQTLVGSRDSRWPPGTDTSLALILAHRAPPTLGFGCMWK